MKNKIFFENQSHLTSAKIKIYEKYIEGYLPKLLKTYNKCLIIDLFCGSGKNGGNLGSPLVLIDRINYILTSEQFKDYKNLNIQILFNDQDIDNINNLTNELNSVNYNEKIVGITIKNEKYEDYIDCLFDKLINIKTPKFIFLDPFTYSNVKMNDLKKLMSLANTEVLLFIPIFHSYRFASTKKFDSSHNTRKFIEEFTNEGVHDYNGIVEFMLSVKKKLQNELELDYVRPVLLDGGGSKNSLFLLTKHQKGILLMNKIIFKNSSDGYSLKVDKDETQNSLFGIEDTSKFYDNFRINLTDLIKLNAITNSQIIDFSIKEGLLPKHAKAVIIELYNKDLIKVYEANGKPIKSKMKWNIAEEIKSTTFFEWV